MDSIGLVSDMTGYDRIGLQYDWIGLQYDWIGLQYNWMGTLLVSHMIGCFCSSHHPVLFIMLSSFSAPFFFTFNAQMAVILGKCSFSSRSTGY